MDENRAKRTAQRDELRKEVLTSSDPLKAFLIQCIKVQSRCRCIIKEQ